MRSAASQMNASRPPRLSFDEHQGLFQKSFCAGFAFVEDNLENLRRKQSAEEASCKLRIHFPEATISYCAEPAEKLFLFDSVRRCVPGVPGELRIFGLPPTSVAANRLISSFAFNKCKFRNVPMTMLRSIVIWTGSFLMGFKKVRADGVLPKLRKLLCSFRILYRETSTSRAFYMIQLLNPLGKQLRKTNAI
jgi:hypothetical protein